MKPACPQNMEEGDDHDHQINKKKEKKKKE